MLDQKAKATDDIYIIYVYKSYHMTIVAESLFSLYISRLWIRGRRRENGGEEGDELLARSEKEFLGRHGEAELSI